jgi:hypothetical protein
MENVVQLYGDASPEDDAFTEWMVRRITFNSAREIANRVPTVNNLGPLPGTPVEVELRPRGDDEVSPLLGRNRVYRNKHIYLGTSVRLPESWPMPRSHDGWGYEARYRVIDESEVPRRTRASTPRSNMRVEVERLRAELAEAQAQIAELRDAPTGGSNSEVERLQLELTEAQARITELTGSEANELADAKAKLGVLAEEFGGKLKIGTALKKPDTIKLLIDRVFSRTTGSDILDTVRAYHRKAPGWLPSEVFKEHHPR